MRIFSQVQNFKNHFSTSQLTMRPNYQEVLQQLTSTERAIISYVHSWNKEYPPNASDVKKGLNMPQSTVSTALKRMVASPYAKNKIFDWSPRHSITITVFGTKIAQHISQHHHIFELFLHKELHLTKEEAHLESENIGNNISCKITSALVKKMEKMPWSKNCVCPENYHQCAVNTNHSFVR